MVDTAIFGGSDVRRQILRTFFARPGVTRHVRELARELGRSATIVGEELDRLERAGILTSERIGRARRYRIDEASPIASEIRSLVQKTIGVDARLKEAVAGVPGIDEAFLYGSYARGDERATSDLDLFVVGSVDQELLSERLSDAERDLGRDVNIVNYARAELDRLRDEGDPFVLAVLDGPRVPIIGPQVG
jgi:predicted nucleotidyltransferase